MIFIFYELKDEGVPWYGDEYWDFVRGQLSSVDRDYGWAHNLVHNIGTHQVSLVIIYSHPPNLDNHPPIWLVSVWCIFGGTHFSHLKDKYLQINKSE